MNFNFGFNNTIDPFADFMDGLRPKRPVNPLIPDNLFQLQKKQTYMGPEPPDKFVNPEGDPKSRAKKDAMLDVGLALLSNAFKPGSNIGEGIGQAIATGASSYRNSRNRYTEEDRTLEDRALRNEIAREQLGQSRESHGWSRDRFGREEIDWKRGDEYRDSVGDLAGNLFGGDSPRARLAAAAALGDPGRAVGMMDHQLQRPEDLADQVTAGRNRSDQEFADRQKMFDLGWDVPEGEKWDWSKGVENRNFELRKSENDLNRSFGMFRLISDDMTAKDSRDMTAAQAATRAQLNAEAKTNVFTAMKDADAEAMSKGRYGQLLQENLRAIQRQSGDAMRGTYDRLGRAFPNLSFPSDLFLPGDNFGDETDPERRDRIGIGANGSFGVSGGPGSGVTMPGGIGRTDAYGREMTADTVPLLTNDGFGNLVREFSDLGPGVADDIQRWKGQHLSSTEIRRMLENRRAAGNGIVGIDELLGYR